MRKIILSAVFIIGFLILSYEEYTYRELRWLSIGGIIVHLQFIWYNNELIFLTWDPKLDIELAVNHHSAIVLRINDQHSYSSLWYDRYYYIPDKKWFNESEWRNFLYHQYNSYLDPMTQFYSLNNILYYENYRKEIESTLGYLNTTVDNLSKSQHDTKAELLVLPL